MGPAAAIRTHHRDAHVTLLTTAPFAELGRRAPYFDAVWIDDRPSLLTPRRLLALRRRLRRGGFARVYDLQTSDRSSAYFRLMGPGRRPQWSGIAKGASHRHDDPARDAMHTLDRQRDQLRGAGIADPPPPDLSWAAEDIAELALPERFVVLVPGGAAHRPEKRWPVSSYAALAARLAASGLASVVVGGDGERPLGAAIRAACPSARDLTGSTSLGAIVGLGRAARRAVGNDTGPMHLLVGAGCPATVLYSAASDPALTAPRGPDVVILRRESLAALPVEEVAATLGIG
ncbi:MAG: glycosyltransferase family 9 protein [Alphaproteobacteria bacterium]|nr:glycosyltransferase family 9 protein [Alphaproteobacteria bacterium]